jgi:hypothetical protein
MPYQNIRRHYSGDHNKEITSALLIIHIPAAPPPPQIPSRFKKWIAKSNVLTSVRKSNSLQLVSPDRI